MMIIDKIRCKIKGHNFTQNEESSTAVRLLEEELARKGRMLTSNDLDSIYRLVRTYKKTYGNSRITNMVCARCGEKVYCVETFRKRINEDLDLILTRRN